MEYYRDKRIPRSIETLCAKLPFYYALKQALRQQPEKAAAVESEIEFSRQKICAWQAAVDAENNRESMPGRT